MQVRYASSEPSSNLYQKMIGAGFTSMILLPGVIRNASLGERDIEIRSHEHFLSMEVKIGDVLPRSEQDIYSLLPRL